MRQIIFILAIVLFSSTLFAQKVGDTVVVIAKNKAELKIGGDIVGTVIRGNHLRVDDVNGEWFWVLWKGKKGWIRKSDVIHIDKAIDFFTRAIGRNPTAADHVSRGNVRDDKGEHEKAINDYNEAIRLDPRDSIAYYNRGLMWDRKGEYEKAFNDYNEAIRLDPRHAETYNNRGTAWITKGQLDKGINDYNEAIKLDLRFSLAFYNRGTAWKAKGQLDRAISDFNEVIRLDPKFFKAYNNIAWLQATCQDARYRDGKKAVENARKACELLNWKNSIAIGTLAAAYAENGEFDQAIRWIKKAIEMAPKNNTETRTKMLAAFQSGKPYREKLKKNGSAKFPILFPIASSEKKRKHQTM